MSPCLFVRGKFSPEVGACAHRQQQSVQNCSHERMRPPRPEQCDQLGPFHIVQLRSSWITARSADVPALREYLFPIRACALAPRRHVKRHWQCSARSKAASKTATFRSPRSPSIGSAYAIGRHTQSIVVLSARADCARVLYIRALLAAGALNLSNR